MVFSVPPKSQKVVIHNLEGDCWCGHPFTAPILLRDTSEDRERLWELIETRWPHHIEGQGGTGDAAHTAWDVIDPAIPTREWFDAILAALRGSGG